MKTIEFMTEPEIEEFMSKCGRSVLSSANELKVENPLFVLLVFNDPKLVQYISNCDNEKTIVETLRIIASMIEGNKQNHDYITED